MKGVSHERCTGSRGHPQGCVHPDRGRQAQAVERERPSLRRLGDLSPEGITRRSEPAVRVADERVVRDRKSTRLNSSHLVISYAVFCLKKKKKIKIVS